MKLKYTFARMILFNFSFLPQEKNVEHEPHSPIRITHFKFRVMKELFPFVGTLL